MYDLPQDWFQNDYGRYSVPEGLDHRPAVRLIKAGKIYEPNTIRFTDHQWVVAGHLREPVPMSRCFRIFVVHNKYWFFARFPYRLTKSIFIYKISQYNLPYERITLFKR